MQSFNNLWSIIPLVLLIIIGIHYVKRLIDSHRSQPINKAATSIQRSSIIKIEQKDPKRTPPLFFTGLLFICTIVILTFGLWGLYYIIFSHPTISSTTYIIFIILFVIFPLLCLLDLFVFDRKYYRIGKSHVERHINLTIQEDISSVFEKCRYALSEMKAKIYKADTPHFLKARLDKSIITVNLDTNNCIETIVRMSSDAEWLTVKIDLGINQKNVNEFQSILERLATMDEIQKQTQPQGDIKKIFGKNIVFTHQLLGEVEIKYLSWNDEEKIVKFFDEKNPKTFALKVIHNQLIRPQLKLEEIEKWSDTTLEEICLKFLQNEEEIKTHFEQTTGNNFFERFYSAFRKSNEKTLAILSEFGKSIQSRFEGIGNQLTTIQNIFNSTQLQSVFQTLSSYDFQNLAKTTQILQNMPKIQTPLYFSPRSSLGSLAYRELEPIAIIHPRILENDVPDKTIGILLNNISPELERKRKGAWQTFHSNNVDKISQATTSMREVIRQLLDILGPEEKVKNAMWYIAPKNGTPVHRKMRIRYALAGNNPEVSESTLETIESLSKAVDTVYSKLSAQTHAEEKGEDILAEGCLIACEAIMMLILGDGPK